MLDRNSPLNKLITVTFGNEVSDRTPQSCLSPVTQKSPVNFPKPIIKKEALLVDRNGSEH